MGRINRVGPGMHGSTLLLELRITAGNRCGGGLTHRRERFRLDAASITARCGRNCIVTVLRNTRRAVGSRQVFPARAGPDCRVPELKAAHAVSVIPPLDRRRRDAGRRPRPTPPRSAITVWRLQRTGSGRSTARVLDSRRSRRSICVCGKSAFDAQLVRFQMDARTCDRAGHIHVEMRSGS